MNTFYRTQYAFAIVNDGTNTVSVLRLYTYFAKSVIQTYRLVRIWNSDEKLIVLRRTTQLRGERTLTAYSG